MGKAFFVTGTDTEVGKTFASCAMLHHAKLKGLRTIALKPVAAGSEQRDRLVNEDACQLIEAMSEDLAYDQVNPVLLDEPTSPHIAAFLAQRQVSVSRIVGVCRGALMQPHDFAIVEGAGGWRVPLNHRETMADLARQLDFPVIMVVALKLGCINHALLTAEAIQNDGLKLAGWIGNRVHAQPMAQEDHYIATLKAAIGAPNLGCLPYDPGGQSQMTAQALDLSVLNL